MGRASWTALPLLLVAATPCGSCDSSKIVECGFGGEHQKIAAESYCVYSSDDVRQAGSAFECPPGVPYRVDLDGAVVCTSDDASTAADLPAEICRLVERACGLDHDAGTEPDLDAGPPRDAARDSDPTLDAGPPDAQATDGGGDAGAPGCEGPPTRAGGRLDTSTSWACAVEVTAEVVVDGIAGMPPAVLTIEPGTVVRFAASTRLLIGDSGRIDARGTAEQPIVLTSTSDAPERRPGQWGGVHVFGNAPIGTPGGIDNVFGLSWPEAIYGGDDPEHDCGTLQYVRIELAGAERGPSSANDGLTIGGCGRPTLVSHVQVHRSSHDGVEVRGGLARIDHLVVTGAADVGLRWAAGWQGTAQHVIVHQWPAGSSGATRPPALSGSGRELLASGPVSSPRMYNVTVVGPAGAGAAGSALELSDATGLGLRDFVFLRFAGAAVDVTDRATSMGVGSSLVIASGLFTQRAGASYFPDDGTGDGVDEAAAFGPDNRFDEDPLLGPFDPPSMPGFVPAAGSPLGTGASGPPAPFEPADYLGAVAPGGPDWTEGWCDYSSD